MFVEKRLETAFRGYRSITEEVKEAVAESGVEEGICTVFLPEEETGLSITSFWDERGLLDLLDEIERNIPARVNYKNQFSPFNASGRVKGAVVGRSTTLLIHGGKLLLGSSQGLVFLEFDGPRERRYCIQVEARKLKLSRHQVNSEYMEMHDVTPMIRDMVRESGVKEGICHISQLHSTAGLLLGAASEAERINIMDDLERMVPTRADFKHRETASDAGGHVKTAITGSQISLAVSGGEPVLGEGQAVIFAEYDGPRPRTYYIGIMDK